MNNKILDTMLLEPHLLIAGTTGSGKTYLLNKLVGYGSTSYPIEFILLDFKQFELIELAKKYHLKHFYKLEDIEKEIEAFYTLMIKRSNLKLKMPSISLGHKYLVIDEYFDIKINCKKETIKKLQLLLAKGRALNLHIIICTQRITAVIDPCLRVNIPARIGLRTISKEESKHIIGQAGCEELDKYGYGLYQSPQFKGIRKIEI